MLESDTGNHLQHSTVDNAVSSGTCFLSVKAVKKLDCMHHPCGPACGKCLGNSRGTRDLLQPD
jgi:hypothetical protein